MHDANMNTTMLFLALVAADVTPQSQHYWILFHNKDVLSSPQKIPLFLVLQIDHSSGVQNLFRQTG